jgi:hypothetical protein
VVGGAVAAVAVAAVVGTSPAILWLR